MADEGFRLLNCATHGHTFGQHLRCILCGVAYGGAPGGAAEPTGSATATELRNLARWLRQGCDPRQIAVECELLAQRTEAPRAGTPDREDARR